MIFVITDLLFPLIAALLLGLGLGWLMWRWRHRHVTSLEWDTVLAESSARHARIMELEDLVEGQEREVVALPAETPEVVHKPIPAVEVKPELAQSDSTQSDLDSPTADLEEALAAAHRRIAQLEAQPREPDDLKKIKGVGPKLEEILHGAGILAFSDLAELDEAGVEALQAQLVQFPGRVEREDWVGQARDLMN